MDELAKATNESVTNLGNAVSGLDEDLAGTQDAVAENRKDIDKNASRITDTRNKQVLQNARLDNHSERITAAEVALDTKADKTELAAKADKTELANKADKNSVYSKSETDNKFALKADNSVVRAQATDINKLRTDVNAHTKRLDHLDNRVNKLDKDLKRGLAAQAALTGLFQPYTVGKANFTAAVGGYKSQTAVAIGTGYRYTQNIATKAGVAFTQGGGVTYNAGVNFEW
ncbi:MAG: YadA C-terminal domain-containing protein [Haemophilus parainfluenzae]|nr:YadA C-terminal domain-containing protein [Haemophilus parainfluenzae]